MSKVRVPVLGTVGKSVRVEENATVGAKIGVDLFLPDGTVPTLAELKAIFATEPAASSVGSLSSTLWRLVREKPQNIVEVAALSSNGLAVRKADGTWVTRSVAVGSAKLTVANADGDAGNPTLDFGTVVLDDLDDVETDGAEDGDVLVFDSAMGVWVPEESTGGGKWLEPVSNGDPDSPDVLFVDGDFVFVERELL